MTTGPVRFAMLVAAPLSCSFGVSATCAADAILLDKSAATASTGVSRFRVLAQDEARRAGVPMDLVDAVMRVESGYDPTRIGAVGEIGLMQVRPATAAMLGFRGTAESLADPATNIHYGVTYLRQAWQLTHGDVCRTLMKYRAGHGQEAMSQLSATYCSRALAHLASISSPLAIGVVVPAALGGAAAIPSSPAPLKAAHVAIPRHGQAFWRAEEARVSAITARLHAKWHLADRN